MKRISVLALLIVIAGMFSCGKELSEENGNSNLSGRFRANIDGTPWVADRLATATIIGGFITLYGGGNDQKSMTITVADSGVHSYQFYNTSLTNVGVYEDSAVSPVAAWSTNQWFLDGSYGDLNITRIDTVRNTMSGTFGMRVFRSLDGLFREISSGVFTEIPYTGTDPVTPLQDTFVVKKDGAQFTYTRLDIQLVGGTTISIAASQNLAPEAVNLNFPDDIMPGINPFDVDITGIFNQAPTVFYSTSPNGSGILTILENNPITQRVRGTFSFVAENPTATPTTYTFTEGYFAVTYQ
jgi:hypothetical protein